MDEAGILRAKSYYILRNDIDKKFNKPFYFIITNEI